MTRERRPNMAHVRYSREDLEYVLRGAGVNDRLNEHILDSYERRRTEGRDLPCQSVVHHGPGHQSTTFCQATGGPDGHDKDSHGNLVHVADLPSGGTAEWTDERPYSDHGWI